MQQFKRRCHDKGKISLPNNERFKRLLQIIRIVANIAINPEIGKLLNDNHGKQLIDEFLKVIISNPFKGNEELVLSVLSTLNNLSFYYTAEMDKDILHVKQIDIIQGEIKILLTIDVHFLLLFVIKIIFHHIFVSFNVFSCTLIMAIIFFFDLSAGDYRQRYPFIQEAIPLPGWQSIRRRESSKSLLHCKSLTRSQ